MRFYVLSQRSYKRPKLTDTEFGDWDAGTDNTEYPPRCPVCGECVGSLRWRGPYRIELELWGKGFGDLAFGTGNYILVSERFKCLWEEHGLKGLGPFSSVQIMKIIRHKRSQNEPPRYYVAEVLRGQGAVDIEKSELEGEGPVECSYCLRMKLIKRIKRVVIISSTWGGEDIFIPRGLSGLYLVSERFKELCETFNITNAVLIPAEEYSFDFYPWENDGQTG